MMPVKKDLIYLFILLLVVLAACRPTEKTDKPLLTAFQQKGIQNDRSLFFIDSTDLDRAAFNDLLRAYLEYLSEPLEYKTEIEKHWYYAPGDPANGLRVSWEQMPSPDTLIDLPHRIHQPNWPLWYQRSISVPEAVYLYANGDDGVQCYLDGILQEPVAGNYFRLEAGRDSVLVSLRVLNNALQGGLRRVALISASDFEGFQQRRAAALTVRQLLYLGSGKNNSRYDSLMHKASRLLEVGELTAVSRLHQDIAAPVLPSLPSANFESSRTGGFSFTAWGDSQGGWPVFDQIVKQMTAHPDAFSIGLGDLVAEGVEEAQWMAFTQCLQPLLAQRPIFAVAGNHDYDGYYNDLNPLLYRRYVLAGKDRPTYFSWTYGNACFLALDPNATFPIGISGDQRAWMEAEMNSPEWEAADWRFILIHQPPYAQGWPEYHGDDFIREIVDSLAESKRIDFVLAGHSHDYERLSKAYGGRQTHFFVLGGAGGGLEPPESSAYPKMDTIIKAHHYARFTVSKEQVKVWVYAPDSALLEELVLKQQ